MYSAELSPTTISGGVGLGISGGNFLPLLTARPVKGRAQMVGTPPLTPGTIIASTCGHRYDGVMDRFSPQKRSSVMACVKSRDTGPEKLVRSLLHAMGYRFRLHRKDLPGTPDIVLPRYKTVIFVHGCFWHQHDCCKRAKLPTTNTDFWQKKLTANKKRDARIAEELEKLGWRVLVIWECELKNREALCEHIRQCLPNERKYSLAPHMGESRR